MVLARCTMACAYAPAVPLASARQAAPAPGSNVTWI